MGHDAGKVQRLPAMRAAPTGSALDRISDAQLMAVQARVLQGWNTGRIARELDVDLVTVARWFREPMVIAAGAEMMRAYAALELLPLGLQRLRQEMSNPFAKTAELVRATEFFAKLAGLSGDTTPSAGRFAPTSAGLEGISARPISELSANDLQALATRGREALSELQRQIRPAPADSCTNADDILS